MVHKDGTDSALGPGVTGILAVAHGMRYAKLSLPDAAKDYPEHNSVPSFRCEVATERSAGSTLGVSDLAGELWWLIGERGIRAWQIALQLQGA